MLLKSSEDVSVETRDRLHARASRGIKKARKASRRIRLTKISLPRSRMSAALRLLIGSGRVSGLTASMRFPISTRHLTFF
jgi:hypothetical protein